MTRFVPNGLPSGISRELNTETPVGLIRVTWTGKPYGHAQWPEYTALTMDEMEAAAWLNMKMPAPYIKVHAGKFKPGRDAWGTNNGSFITIGTRKRNQAINGYLAKFFPVNY